jgi:long-chain acyl-CoA synthetase
MDYLERTGFQWSMEQLTFPELLNRNVTRFPSRKAQTWKDKNGVIQYNTYAGLGRIVKEITCGLMDLGFKSGDRAALMCNTRPEWMQCDYGILCAGGITVCVYPSLSESEMTYILKDSGSKILFIEDMSMLAQA